MTDYKEIKRATNCSTLQSLMICRVWCKGHDLAPLSPDEVFTKLSLPSLPPRWKRLSPACFGRSLWSVAMELPVCREIMVLSLAEGIQMYSASHVEHKGC
jgi:hypothetical protein